jgi:predicted transcriptional regulator
MEWSRRELESIQSPSNGRLSTAVGNMHSALCKVGVLEWEGQPTAIGRVVKTIVGQTSQQRSKATLERTFNHLISTLEENISNEMERASTLFQLFETVDIQFQQLHRSVAREEDQMANEKDQFLASLWRRSMGSNLKLKKYEKNLKLLSTVRSSTFNNLIDLKEHTRLISSVQEQLDGARKKLVSPLIQSAQSNSFGLGHQFADLSKTYTFLKGLRDTQRHRVLQALWAEPKQRVQITSGQESPELESY